MPSPVLASIGLEFAIRESTTPGLVICCILVLLSSISWAIMITKLFVVMRARSQAKKFMREFRSSRHPLEMFADQAWYGAAPPFGVYHAASRELTYHLLGTPEVDSTFRARLQNAERITPSQMDAVTTAMERAVGEMVEKLEARMSFLATAVSGAPFLGLLGTVWGVMDTFGGVAAADGVATLKTMAPGVSAALVTTVVALLVAIPAMFGYNYLVSGIRSLISQLDNFAAELSNALHRTCVNHAQPVTYSGAVNWDAHPSTQAEAPAPQAAEPEPTPAEPQQQFYDAPTMREDQINPVAKAVRYPDQE